MNLVETLPDSLRRSWQPMARWRWPWPSLVPTEGAVSWVLSVGLAALVALSVFSTPLVVPDREWILWPASARELSVQWHGAFVPLFTVANVSVVAGVVVARRLPLLATGLAAWPLVTIALFGTTVWGWWLGMAAVAVCAAVERPRRAALPWVLAVGLVAIVNAAQLRWLLPEGAGTLGGPGGWWYVTGYSTYSAAAVAVSAAIGVALRARARTFAARTTERHALAVESTASERARLARDLHDIVAHHVSLIAVRAESAPYALPGLSAGTKEVLREIVGDARSALDELRQVLTVLQRTEEPARTPQPGADDVESLVAGAVAAGQRIELRGKWTGMPAAGGYALYRAVQEGLTNVRRHAPGAAAALVLEGQDDVVGFRLTNPAATATNPVEPGRGLIGMRERIETLGGAVSAEVEDEAFVLVVTLPRATS